VLLGDFLASPAHPERWFPLRGGYRIWVLSERVRQVLQQEMGFAPGEIGIVPRSAFGRIKRQQRSVDFHQPQTFVYAGRLLPEKNIFKSIEFVRALSELTGTPMKFRVFTQDLPNPRVMAWFHRELEAKGIHQRDLGLASDPRWFEAKLQRPILINFSTALTEDFGVSVRLAKIQGWPVITSDWGALAEERGANCWQIPTSLLGARGAQKFFQDPSAFCNPVIDQQIDAPRPVTYQRLREILDQNQLDPSRARKIMQGRAI
jgi:glycosyltransferase involved in cell wall biosynthesis